MLAICVLNEVLASITREVTFSTSEINKIRKFITSQTYFFFFGNKFKCEIGYTSIRIAAKFIGQDKKTFCKNRVFF